MQKRVTILYLHSTDYHRMLFSYSYHLRVENVHVCISSYPSRERNLTFFSSRPAREKERGLTYAHGDLFVLDSVELPYFETRWRYGYSDNIWGVGGGGVNSRVKSICSSTKKYYGRFPRPRGEIVPLLTRVRPAVYRSERTDVRGAVIAICLGYASRPVRHSEDASLRSRDTHFHICRVLSKRDDADGRQSDAQNDNVGRHNGVVFRMPGKREKKTV